MATTTLVPTKDAILFPDTSRIWTYEDIKDWKEVIHCEIINGGLHMSSTPNFYHQEVSGNVYTLMRKFIKKHKLGKIISAPQDTRLGEFNLVQPDILFLSKENINVRIEGTEVGAPDLDVEIISPPSIRRNYHQIKDIYEAHLVQEYWIIDPANQAVEVFWLNGEKYELIAFAEMPKKIVISKVLQGFEVTLAEIFEEQ